MNFDLSEDEEMLKAVAERFVTDRYDHDSRRAFLAEPNGFSHENWSLLGELGLIAAPLPEEHGGLGLDPTALATVFEALGRGLFVEPLAENVVLAARILASNAPAALRDELLPGVMSGERRVALAHAEEGARGGSQPVRTRATTDGGGFRLSGSKPYVIAGGGAVGYLVSARLDGGAGDDDGCALFYVPADAPGVSIRTWHLADGTVSAALSLDGVSVPQEHRLSGGIAAIAEAEQMATLARCAEALGIMQRMFEDTLGYLRSREQFGAPLGSFQAIQHRMVAQYAVIEQSRALLNLALVSEGEAFATAVQGARAFIADASVRLGHEMIQFHGGMGVTDELAIGGGHKRLLVLSRWPESADVALDRYAGVLR